MYINVTSECDRNGIEKHVAIQSLCRCSHDEMQLAFAYDCSKLCNQYSCTRLDACPTCGNFDVHDPIHAGLPQQLFCIR